VHLVVDDRERAGEAVWAALAKRDDAAIEIARLRVGDYRVERRVVVERKTASDFAVSLIDGRLFRQAASLAAAPERAVLVLEGGDKDWQDTGVRHESIQGALIAIAVFFSVTVLRSDGPEETARLLVYLGRQARRSAHGGLPRSGYRPKGKRALQLFLLQGLPGVGPERAARLLERFGSVQAIMTPRPTISPPLTASAKRPRGKCAGPSRKQPQNTAWLPGSPHPTRLTRAGSPGGPTLGASP